MNESVFGSVIFCTCGVCAWCDELRTRRTRRTHTKGTKNHAVKHPHIIIGIQPSGRSGQRPEFSQATGMALVRCTLGKFLGVDCHCFPPLFRCSHFSPPGASTSATTWEIPAAEVGTVGRVFYPVILPKWRLSRHLGIFYMRKSTTWDRRLYFPSEGRRAEYFFARDHAKHKR